MKKKLHQYEVMCIGLLLAVFGIVAWRVHAGGVTVMDTYIRGLVKGLQTEGSLAFSHTIQIRVCHWDCNGARYKFTCFLGKKLLCCDDRVSNGHFNNTSCE